MAIIETSDRKCKTEDRTKSACGYEFIDGSTAIVRGAIAAGCNFFAGYPITPASSILQKMMRAISLNGGVAIQAEDEMASIGLLIGAAASGCKAMTATSGPGLSLLSENIGLAIMMEIPLVIVDVQRLGPATGGATTVGQGDIQFVRWGTSGGYPIIALAPSSVPECYSLTIKAFELAHLFRIPVFLITDKELNMTMTTVSAEAWQEPHPTSIQKISTSPLIPFGSEALVRLTGSTHDEKGFITGNPPTVEALNTRLSKKIEEKRKALEIVQSDLQEGAKTLWISFGVTAATMREAVHIARNKGHKVSALNIQSLWPIPEMTIKKASEGIELIVVAELNHGQYRREIESLIPGLEIVGLNRVDGQLITPSQFMGFIR